MAYQNISTPRFYVSVLQWLKSLGKIYVGDTVGSDFEIGANQQEALSLLDLNPTHTKFAQADTDGSYEFINYTMDEPVASYSYKDQGFAMVLNHNFKSSGAKFIVKEYSGSQGNYFGNGSQGTMVNYSLPAGNTEGGSVQYDGWSLVTAGDISDLQQYASIKLRMAPSDDTAEAAIYDLDTTRLKLGSFLFGNYYDMPHSPDMNLTMTREYGGYKEITTKGGASLSNSFYRGSPNWGDAGAWELYFGTPSTSGLSRSGRRIWNLSFSYLSDSDIFPDTSSLINYETTSPDGTVWHSGLSDTDNTLLKENTFFSQVLHKTNGGQLPFVFQPDNSNFNPDQFAICKLDMNSFQFSQKSVNVYDIKLKIREVW